MLLVSAIMPTCNRPQYIEQAIRCFLAQTYPHKELVIVDDGDSIKHLVPTRPDILYESSWPPLRIGPKRNLACGLASGDIIAHWDDDDWSAPDRIEQQLRMLVRAR